MELQRALEWISGRRNGVLVTLRRDGRAQSSDIAYAVNGDVVVVSLTTDRAKAANMRRDPRIVLHVSDPARFSYVSFDGVATLTEVCADPNDAVADALVAYYTAVSGEHPNWAEFRQAMVDERRLLAHLHTQSVTGQIHG
jgi:PPOX class probable F420-dependent enzyme